MEDDVLLSTGGAMWLKFPPVIGRQKGLPCGLAGKTAAFSLYPLRVAQVEKDIITLAMRNEVGVTPQRTLFLNFIATSQKVRPARFAALPP